MIYKNGIWIPEAPNLILGRGPCPRPTTEVFIESPKPKLAGFVKWELGKFTGPKKDQYVKATGGFHQNLITDAGLDGIGTTLQPIGISSWMAVGTGSTAPANSQTTLVAEVGRVNRSTTGDGTKGSGPAFAYWFYQVVRLFLETEANGNLTEVGMFSASSSGIMFMRQLFKDISGTPTTVIKTASDQLKVTWELRAYSPTVDTTQTGLVISGTSYNVTTRAEEIDTDTAWGNGTGGSGFLGSLSNWGAPFGRAYDASAALGTTQTRPTGSAIEVQSDSGVASAYTTGNFFRDVTLKWEPGSANGAGGLGAFATFGSSSVTPLFQSLFTPAFAKDATKRLTLVVRCSWDRH